ncbi:MAG TPA: C40 family peptidase, partial [Gemmatimonadaceae bacterium]|nr:C40 family peptidase [Gemmatimonadaceae bacterium]
MSHLLFVPRSPRRAALFVGVANLAAVALLIPGTVAAQVSVRAAGVATASALRPELGVPLAVLVRIGSDVLLRRSRRTSSRTTPRTTPTTTTTSTRSSATAARVLTTADRYLGTPYVFGGTTPDGFDCSGFVQYVYRRQGVTLPRTAAQQGGAGEKVRVAVKELRAGDLMLFDASSKRPGIDHVAIYAGNGRMIHSSSSGGGVAYDDL